MEGAELSGAQLEGADLEGADPYWAILFRRYTGRSSDLYATQSRINAPGALHHTSVRGTDRRKRYFLTILIVMIF